MKEIYINYNEIEDIDYLCELLDKKDKQIEELKKLNKEMQEKLKMIEEWLYDDESDK